MTEGATKPDFTQWQDKEGCNISCSKVELHACYMEAINNITVAMVGEFYCIDWILGNLLIVSGRTKLGEESIHVNHLSQNLNIALLIIADVVV